MVRTIAIGLCACCLAIAATPVAVQSASIGIGSNARVDVPLKSWKALRDQDVVKQRYDYSCGAAALATLLTYGFGDETTERAILRSIIETLSATEEQLRKKQGLSLLDLKRAAESRGYAAQGFKLSPQFVPRLGGPVIVFIKPLGYEHFAVLRGVRGDRVHLADPARGNVRMPLHRFFDIWLGDDGKGIIFIVESGGGGGADALALDPTVESGLRPEILTARQMLEVGNPFARLPELLP